MFKINKKKCIITIKGMEPFLIINLCLAPPGLTQEYDQKAA